MATAPGTVAFLLEQMEPAGVVSARRMFGEYAIYLEGKVVGLVIGDRLFVKPTPGALALAGDVALERPVPQITPYLPVEDVDDAGALVALIRAAWADLPVPPPKKPRKTGTPRKE
ncbi:TfoX/Sxy family protein [Frigidibacter oleivorans]|uniref:TfoX/Sxy family protein n=1 Tax=Frigidibacter oleivorans TaxID=2487129 RepID=UPI000F8EAB2A|nr:TfoX/Sxy family protein [Frigidibacter oleivorans]